ncbi:MAG: hypothetical protein ACLSAH_01845 [Bilophila wadsworthia]
MRERVGQEVESLTSTQQLVKAVHDELVTLLGGETTELNLRRAARRHHDGGPSGFR